MPLSRRDFIKAGGLALAGGAGIVTTRAFLARDDEEALRPLAVPPLLDARKHGQGLELEVREGATEFFAGRLSRTMGYNGSYLGPTLLLYRSDDVQLSVRNSLRYPTTVHWHGLVVPGPLDGGPHQEIAPGAAWRPVLPVRQRAATLFYHSHVHGATAEQVYRGLAGVLLVRDGEEAGLGLPSEYGIDDIPVVIQDREFRDGMLVLPAGMMTLMHGRRGETILANGTRNAMFKAPARRLRLRLVNGSNARVYHLSFDDGRSFEWIATEGGLLPAPVNLRLLALAPGQRAEILVDFTAGGSATLQTAADSNLPMGMMGRLTDAGSRDPQNVLVIEAGPPGQPAPALLTRLSAALPEVRQAGRRRRFVLGMGMGPRTGSRGMGGGGMMGGMGLMTINARPFEIDRVDESVRLGETEVWEVSGEVMAHPFHIHGVQFQVLSRAGAPAALQDQGLRDTILVEEPVELLVQFTQPSERAPFMYHCHILEHEDNGMMGQFSVST